MNFFYLCVVAFLLCMAVHAEGFPDIEQLPSKPEFPDPLTMLSGEKVTTKEQWFQKRKPELKKLFEHYMYGIAPAAPKIEAKIVTEDKNYFGGKATKKDIEIRYGPPTTPVLHVLLIIPNKRTQPAPVFVGPNFHGNHAVVADSTLALPQVWVPKALGSVDGKATETGRGKEVDVWNIENSIARGYAVATYYAGDMDPDKNDFSDGVHAAFMKEGEKRNNQSWGTVAAWAFGMQRIVDYLVTDADLDKSKIIATGHSRLGKTAMLATAFDDRIAMAIPLQAGCGGTAPSRGKIGEPVARINKVFPHWFCDEYKKFNEQTDKLPFDQHCLVAMCAPRPVLFSNAAEDTWANPAGQFDVLAAADPVYRLLGAGGMDAKTMPETGKLVDSTLGYFIRAGKHNMALVDWNAFLDFADKHLGKPK